MTDNKTGLSDSQLEDIFASARQSDVVPSDDFMARILADAAEVSESWAAVPAPVETGSIWATIWTMIGGWAGTGGLAAATAAGLWIGIASPDALSGVNEAIWGTSVDVSLFSSDDVFGVEG